MADDARARAVAIARARARATQPIAEGSSPPAPPEPGMMDKLKDFGMGALETAAPVLDYAGGLSRTAAAGVYDMGAMAAGAPTVTRPGDVMNAFQGKAPPTATFLERGGAPEGASLSDAMPSLYSPSGSGIRLQEGGWADPTVRGAVGFVGDVALDPLTYLSGGTSAAAKTGIKETAEGLGKEAVKTAAKTSSRGLPTSALQKLADYSSVTRPASKSAELAGELATSAGNAFTRSGVKNVDRVLKERGKRPLSDILIEHNIGGSAEKIHDSLDALGEQQRATRGALYQKADEAGARINEDDIISEFKQYTNNLRQKTKIKMDAKLANSLEKWAHQNVFTRGLPKPPAPAPVLPPQQKTLLESLGVPQPPQPKPKPPKPKPPTMLSLEDASAIKTRLRQELPASFYTPTGKIKPGIKEATNELSSIYQRKIENTANRAVPDLGNEIADVNKKWGTLIDADSPMSREARKEIRTHGFTTMDAMYGGATMAATQNPKLAASMAALKKAADISKTTGFRTRMGQGFRALGTAAKGTGAGVTKSVSPWVDPGARRYAIDWIMKDERDNEGY